MVINHLVLSGGGVVGLVQYGILKQLTKMNIINYKNIKSIYATSIGTYISLIYLLNYKWEWMDDFLIK
jgi:predicted acylesterase/phospholipase RssA